MDKLRAWVLTGWLSLSVHAVVQGAESAAPPYQPDWPKIAKLILHRSLQLAPGQRVILHYLPGHNPGLVEALRMEVVTSGAMISAELTWPTAEVGKYYDTLSAEQKGKLAEAQNAVYREIFARSDLYLWLDVSPVEDLVPRQFEHLVSESKVRAIHCHFFDSPDSRERDRLWQMYERAIELEPAQLQAVMTPLTRELRGTSVRMTSPAGTDLTFRIPAEAWFHANTGDAGPAKPRRPTSKRDREEEIPAGALRTVDVASATGKLVATVQSALPADTVTLTFKDGRIVKVDPKPGGQGEDFAKWYNTTTGDRDRISEIVIGTNPELTPILPSRFMPHYGYGAGIVRVAIGENWESGGPLRTSDHAEWWLFVTDGTLKAGQHVVINQGHLTHP
jgi:leucyl aminopeptidase (aminopeptidase T)